MIHGCIDAAEATLHGWVFDDDCPNESLEVDIFVGGFFFKKLLANGVREDLKTIKTGYLNHGFSCPLPLMNRPDSVIFARVNGERFIVQSPIAQQHHLIPRVHHLSSIYAAPIRDTVYRGAASISNEAIIERIAKMLMEAKKTASNYGPLWGNLISGHHRELLDLVELGDLQALAAYLSELGRQQLALGFFDGPDAHVGASTNPAFRIAAATLILDRLLSLNEALGSLRVENPEQGAFGAHIRCALDDLLGSALKVLGIEHIECPVGGFWGLQTRFGIINVRMLDALHAAYRIKCISQRYKYSNVTEIGGGAGLVAHYGLAMGIRNYTIVDLPTTAASQAFCLQTQSNLILYGEKEEKQDCAVRLLPTWEFTNSAAVPGGMLFSMDALPEIETEAAVNYLRDARALGYSHFLSLNQESGSQIGDWSQNRVEALAQRAEGYHLISRNRDWMRPGYVEELYEIR